MLAKGGGNWRVWWEQGDWVLLERPAVQLLLLSSSQETWWN